MHGPHESPPSPAPRRFARSGLAATGLFSLLSLALTWAACNTPKTLGIEPWACGAPGQASYGAYGASAPGSGSGSSTPDSGTNWNHAGLTTSVVVADQWNNRVIVIDRQGNVLWSFGDGQTVAGPTSVITPNDAERLANGDVLIAGTGATSGPDSGCAGLPVGALRDDRVILVDHASRAIVWQYGGHGTGGLGDGKLSSPTFAVYVPNGSSCGDDILIADSGNRRLVEVDRANGSIVWQFPTAGNDAGKDGPCQRTAPAVAADAGSDVAAPDAATDAASLQLDLAAFAPQSAERLSDGNTLITDQGNNLVVEVDTTGRIVWQYPPPRSTNTLSQPAFASRLRSGGTLVADTSNNRVFVAPPGLSPDAGHEWEYVVPWPSGTPAPLPTGAVRLSTGDTLITNSGTNQVIEVSLDGGLLYTHGQFAGAGNAGGELNQPYNAKVVCDYTGLTNAAPDGGCVQ